MTRLMPCVGSLLLNHSNKKGLPKVVLFLLLVIMGMHSNFKEKIKRVLVEMFENYSEIDFNSIKIYAGI